MPRALSDNAKGSLWMSLSMMGFVVNDALMKSALASVPLFQAILIRGLVATSLVLGLAVAFGAIKVRPRGRNAWLIFWRMVAEVGATSLFLTALSQMRLANATAIIQVAPLAITLAAALVLREPVGWRRYSAIGVGFLGMFLIVGPGTEDLGPPAFAAIGAVVFIVLRDLTTRAMSHDVPSLLVTLATAVSITAVAGAVTLARGWESIGAAAPVYALATGALFLVVGYHAGVLAMRVGEIGAVAPFRYTNLIWALALGVVVFGEVPSTIALVGAAIIACAGLYTLHRERVLRRQPHGGAPP